MSSRRGGVHFAPSFQAFFTQLHAQLRLLQHATEIGQRDRPARQVSSPHSVKAAAARRAESSRATYSASFAAYRLNWRTRRRKASSASSDTPAVSSRPVRGRSTLHASRYRRKRRTSRCSRAFADTENAIDSCAATPQRRMRSRSRGRRR